MEEKSVFELIVEGKIPCEKVLESNDFLAFKDIHPKAPIHLLIIPKKHFKDFQSVDASIMSAMCAFIQELATLTGLDKTGYKLLTNNGKAAGQEVFHLHFHMLGGWEK